MYLAVCMESIHDFERLGLLAEGHELRTMRLSSHDAVKERAIVQIAAVLIEKALSKSFLSNFPRTVRCETVMRPTGGRNLSGLGNELRERKSSPRLAIPLTPRHERTTGRCRAKRHPGARLLK